MGISALYGMFAGIYHWFPRMFGRMLKKWDMFTLGNSNLCLWCFLPMHFIGLAGCQDVIPILTFHYFDLQNVNVLITTFALIGAFNWYLVYTSSVVFYGKKSVMNHGNQIL
jgi:cytochrome c oxidase subunit 1